MGKAKIQEGNFKLIHIIELDNYQRFIDEMYEILDRQITKTHPLHPYLNHELAQLQTLLDGLKTHRAKRSLNFIGSAWKWIAGSPDHEDFEIIKSKVNNILENNNKQVIINQLYNERINNITKITNEIFIALHNENVLNDKLSQNIQYKLKLIKEEIINIKYAIHWAKVGIINSLILSNSEIKLAIDTIENENLPYTTPEEALDFSKIKIISNSSCLLYIVYIPLTTTELYEKLLVIPVRKNKKVTEIEYEKILKHQNKLYGIVNDCRSINFLTICNPKDILDISNSSCLPNLLKSRPSKCNQNNNQHISTVNEIAEGVLLLNEFCGDIVIENETQTLNGTYLIKFHNTSLTVNNRVFISREKSTIQVLPAILQPSPQENKFREVLSLQMMKDIHINNTDQIELLQAEKTYQQITSYSSISMLIIILVVFIIIKCKKNKTLRIHNITNIRNPDPAEDNNPERTDESQQHEMEPQNTTSKIELPLKGPLPIPPKRKFYETPFF